MGPDPKPLESVHLPHHQHPGRRDDPARREANNWEIYNNYRQNVLIDGCVYALPDLTASFVRKETVGSDVLLTARIGTEEAMRRQCGGPEVPVSFLSTTGIRLPEAPCWARDRADILNARG